MINNWKRRLWYTVTSPLMWLNGRRYRLLNGRRRGTKVHLGPGQRNYLPGWLNVDANLLTAKIDLWANLLHRFPFADDTIEAMYTWHVLEHLPYDALPGVLREMYRCLRPGGRARIGVPHAGNAARAYAAGDVEWFCSRFPRDHRSLGGKFANYVLCAGEHLQLLDFSFMGELLTDAGFRDVRECTPQQSEHFEKAVLDLENEQPRFLALPHTLVVEATK